MGRLLTSAFTSDCIVKLLGEPSLLFVPARASLWGGAPLVVANGVPDIAGLQMPTIPPWPPNPDLKCDGDKE